MKRIEKNCFVPDSQAFEAHPMCLCTFLAIPTMPSATFLIALACLFTTPMAAASTNSTNGGKVWTAEQLFPLGGYKHFECGTNKSSASEHFLNFHNHLYYTQTRGGSPAARAGVKVRQEETSSSSSPITVDVAFHIVSTTDQQHLVQLPWVDQQMAKLNAMYNNYSISFNLINTSWTVNDAWAVGAGNDMHNMKVALRQGTYATHNIYFMTNLTGNILGTCTMPTNISPGDPSSYTDDGCCVNAGTMPGGPIYGYNEGMTAVHETGHWLGLFHVFENYSCVGDGDYIADTPMQSISTNGCPVGTPPPNSCPQEAGYDNIHNVMDYSDDACYTGFTADQRSRILAMWQQYRRGK